MEFTKVVPKGTSKWNGFFGPRTTESYQQSKWLLKAPVSEMYLFAWKTLRNILNICDNDYLIKNPKILDYVRVRQK